MASKVAEHDSMFDLYERERGKRIKIERLLLRASILLGFYADRLEQQGEDAQHLRAFIEETTEPVI